MRQIIERARPHLGVLLVAAALGQTSCGDESVGDTKSAASPTAASSESVEATPSVKPTATSSPSPEREAADSVVPEELVGTWVSTGAGGAEIIYVIDAAGTYKYAGVLLQERDTGMFSLERSAEGDFRVERSLLVLQPERGTQKVEDPDVPSANRERQIDLKEESFEWTVDNAGGMSLTDASGNTITFARQ